MSSETPRTQTSIKFSPFRPEHTAAVADHLRRLLLGELVEVIRSNPNTGCLEAIWACVPIAVVVEAPGQIAVLFASGRNLEIQALAGDPIAIGIVSDHAPGVVITANDLKLELQVRSDTEFYDSPDLYGLGACLAELQRSAAGQSSLGSVVMSPWRPDQHVDVALLLHQVLIGQAVEIGDSGSSASERPTVVPIAIVTPNRGLVHILCHDRVVELFATGTRTSVLTVESSPNRRLVRLTRPDGSHLELLVTRPASLSDLEPSTAPAN